MKPIFVVLLLILSIPARAVDRLFLEKINIRLQELKREKIDSIIIYGMNNFNRRGMPIAFTVIYQKDREYYREVIHINSNKGYKKISSRKMDSLGYYSIVFQYLRDNYQAVTSQVDTISNIRIQHRVINGQTVKISSNGYMGAGFYLGIFIGDKEYSDNLAVGKKMAYVNSLFGIIPEYWTFFSLLNNIGITQRSEADFW